MQTGAGVAWCYSLDCFSKVHFTDLLAIKMNCKDNTKFIRVRIIASWFGEPVPWFAGRVSRVEK